MKRPQIRIAVISLIAVGANATRIGLSVTIATGVAIAAVTLVDLGTRRGRLIALETVMLGFIGMNFLHDKHSALSLDYDAIALIGGATVLRCAEGPSIKTHETMTPR